MQSTPLLIPLSVIAGGLLALQFAIKALLARAAGTSAVWAALVSVFVSTLALLAIAGATLPHWPQWQEVVRLSPWLWIGGLLGAVFVFVSTLAIGRLGAAAFFAAVIFGQLMVSMIVDHFGLLGLPVAEVNWQRFLALAFVLAGLLLFRSA